MFLEIFGGMCQVTDSGRHNAFELLKVDLEQRVDRVKQQLKSLDLIDMVSVASIMEAEASGIELTPGLDSQAFKTAFDMAKGETSLL